MTTAIYPGSFDPVTMGHLDIIHRASALFERLVVAVFEAPEREALFTTEERKSLLTTAMQGRADVEVKSFRGLVVDFARSCGAGAIVRGLRMTTDFEDEFEMALVNRRLAPDIDVVCFMTTLDYLYVRSSRLKEIARLGGDITGLAPENVVAALRERYGSRA